MDSGDRYDVARRRNAHTVRASSSRSWVAWLFLTLAGTVLIALPDPDRRVFSISEGHGPGVTDLVGAVLLTAGWVVLDVQIWLGRRRLLALRRPRLLLLAVAALGGAVVIAWSVGRDAGMWWLSGVGLLAGAQLVAAIVVTEERVRRGEGTSRAGEHRAERQA